jgi:hypothetical protein
MKVLASLLEVAGRCGGASLSRPLSLRRVALQYHRYRAWVPPARSLRLHHWQARLTDGWARLARNGTAGLTVRACPVQASPLSQVSLPANSPPSSAPWRLSAAGQGARPAGARPPRGPRSQAVALTRCGFPRTGSASRRQI